jgi:glycosyltransferase involved in cell wall biosynthesis
MAKVLFVVRGDEKDVASSKYRVYQYLEYLKKKDIQYHVIKPPRRKKVQAYLWIPYAVKLFIYGFFSCKIFVQKDIFWLGIWRFFKYFGKKIIYDFDDAIFVKSTYGSHVYAFPFATMDSEKLVGQMIALSDSVIVANQYLYNFAQVYTKKAIIIPMALDISQYKAKVHSEKGIVVIGWIGSPQTSLYLLSIQGALKKIIMHYGPRIKIKIVTNGRVELDQVPFEKFSWNQENEIRDILSFDIGIVPIIKDPMSSGKSSFKMLQFMACGLPTVSSDIAFHQEVVVQGENGFIACDEDEWVGRLAQLIDDSKLRARLGDKARKIVEKKYTLQATSPLFRQAIIDI